MRSSLDYAGFAQLCGRSPIMRAHNRIIPRSLAYCAALNSICADETTLRRSSSSSDHSNDAVQLQRQISAARARAAEHRCCSPTVDRRDRETPYRYIDARWQKRSIVGWSELSIGREQFTRHMLATFISKSPQSDIHASIIAQAYDTAVSISGTLFGHCQNTGSTLPQGLF